MKCAIVALRAYHLNSSALTLSGYLASRRASGALLINDGCGGDSPHPEITLKMKSDAPVLK